MAMRLERAHAQFLGEGQGLLVVGFGLCGIGGIGVGMEDAQLVQCARFAPACLLLSGQVGHGCPAWLASYGSANATSASPSLVPSLPCPPAAITTNCLPSGRSRYVIGSAWPLAGSRPFHNSAPVSLSNARR